MKIRSRALPAKLLLSAWAATVVTGACSRTDDPFERYGAAALPSGGATAAGGGGAGSQAGTGGASPSAGRDTAGDAGEGPLGGGAGPEPFDPNYGCGDPPIASTKTFTKGALRSAAADCAEWQYCRFEGAASNLELEVASYADDPTEQTLTAARASLGRAASLWSELELFQFGPLASSSVASGKDTEQGEGLRELIHSWPLTVRCRVEEQIVTRNYLNGMDAVLISARGLFGLDYLLNFDGTDTACTPSSVAGKKWAQTSPEQLAELKLDYAAALGSDVLASIRKVRSRWAADEGNFRPLFVDGTGYRDEKQVMTILAWSLLYVEREVKDWKVGVPAGYTATSPVTLPELPYSGLSTEAIRGNLRGFKRLFEGCGDDGEGLGFDDWLASTGVPDLASDLVAAHRSAEALLADFPPLHAATPAELEALYRAIKGVTDLLKNDLFGSGSPLGLTLPDGIASDTD